jgi:hypothetical protein
MTMVAAVMLAVVLAATAELGAAIAAMTAMAK